MITLFLFQSFFELVSILPSLVLVPFCIISCVSGYFVEIFSVFDFNHFFNLGIGSDNYIYGAPLFTTVFLSILSGIVIGFILGLIGGGGSILGVPLLVYVIGVDIHMAIGTSALAVAANALINLFYRIGKSSIKIKEGILFAVPGCFGALIGSELGLVTPPGSLLILFTIFMIVIAIWMLRNSIKEGTHETNAVKKGSDETPSSKNKMASMNNKPRGIFTSIGTKNDKIIWLINWNIKSFSELMKMNIFRVRKFLTPNRIQNSQMTVENWKNNLAGILLRGLFVGIAAGYFGIGGGFLIVPALIHAVSGIGIVDAVATSLIPVSAFGFVTSFKYAIVGEVNLFIAVIFIIGGSVGGIMGTKLSYRIPKGKLSKTFAIILLIVGFYIFLKLILNNL